MKKDELELALSLDTGRLVMAFPASLAEELDRALHGGELFLKQEALANGCEVSVTVWTWGPESWPKLVELTWYGRESAVTVALAIHGANEWAELVRAGARKGR